MPTFNVTVPLTPVYDNAVQQLVVTTPTMIDLSIDVQEGTHTYTSPFQEVGTLKYFAVPQLEAAIRVTYFYDAAKDTLELYGNDFVSPEQSTCLLIKPVGSEQVCQQHTYLGHNNFYVSNVNWNYSFQYTPGLPDALRDSIRNANERIIAAAKNVFSIVRVNTPPPTLETVEENYKWMTMHDKDGVYLGTFDPTREYPEGTTMTHHLLSTWGGTVNFRLNENIANVIGSSSDRIHPNPMPWIELWERQFGMESACTSHNWASGNFFACNDSVQANRIGGHIITGQVAQARPAGSNDVYILPICKAHNNNNNVYMRANVYTQGIWLRNYLQ